MKGSHCAENIRNSIEEMINKYPIDKSKIVGKRNFDFFITS